MVVFSLRMRELRMNPSAKINRRNAIKSAMLMTGTFLWAPLQKLQFTTQNCIASFNREGVYIFQDRAHFKTNDALESYQKPFVSHSTKQYLDKIDQEEFLKRHWFV